MQVQQIGLKTPKKRGQSIDPWPSSGALCYVRIGGLEERETRKGEEVASILPAGTTSWPRWDVPQTPRPVSSAQVTPKDP